MPRPQRVRLLADTATSPEPLHWALRVSFWALLTPSAWLKAYAPQRNV